MSLFGGIAKTVIGGALSTSGSGKSYFAPRSPYEKFEDNVKQTIGQELAEEGRADIIKSTDVYKEGQREAKKEGYTEASEEYEEKLHKQAEEFLKQKELYKQQREEYDRLLDEYEKVIDTLVKKNNRTEEENKRLQQLLIDERNLRRLSE